jgi:hypothetical protein
MNRFFPMIHGEGEAGMKKQKQHYELDYKRRTGIG